MNSVDPELALETPRLRLDPLREAHAAELFAIYQDPRLYTYIPQDPPASLETLAERCRILERRRSPDGTEQWLNWVLRCVSGGPCLGRVEVTIRPDGTALLAYELGHDSWGRGFATEACRRVIEHLFGDYGVREIVADVDTRNARSIALLERLGFRRVMRRDGADFFKGAVSDEYRYSLEPTVKPKTSLTT